MDPLSKFSIAISGLENGNYSYEFQIDNDFFAQYEASVIHKGDVRVKVGLLKRDDLLAFAIDFDGAVSLPCDRCLEEFIFPVALHKELNVKLKDEVADSHEEDVVIIHRDDHQFSLAGHLYDYLTLHIPYRKLHPEKDGKSACDPETIKVIERLNGQGPKGDDGRWDALKKINLRGN